MLRFGQVEIERASGGNHANTSAVHFLDLPVADLDAEDYTCLRDLWLQEHRRGKRQAPEGRGGLLRFQPYDITLEWGRNVAGDPLCMYRTLDDIIANAFNQESWWQEAMKQ